MIAFIFSQCNVSQEHREMYNEWINPIVFYPLCSMEVILSLIEGYVIIFDEQSTSQSFDIEFFFSSRSEKERECDQIFRYNDQMRERE